MNKSYKVVYNKARKALTVVNEATSSVQAKGAKTVIAAATALLLAQKPLKIKQFPKMPMAMRLG